ELQDTDIFHPTKIRELILEAFDEYFGALKRDLAGALGKVSFTSDLWSNSKLRPFMAITAHWIA
ncbi:hypothetical protein P692DRAFT_201688711, partial [Suillus brevipes Sb2]